MERPLPIQYIIGSRDAVWSALELCRSMPRALVVCFLAAVCGLWPVQFAIARVHFSCTVRARAPLCEPCAVCCGLCGVPQHSCAVCCVTTAWRDAGPHRRPPLLGQVHVRWACCVLGATRRGVWICALGVRTRGPRCDVGGAGADLVLAGVDCDKSVVCTLRHDERLRSGGTAYIQAALLYTTPGGQRRVRVHTLALPIASSLGSVFRGADLDATLQVRPRRASSPCMTTRLLGPSPLRLFMFCAVFAACGGFACYALCVSLGLSKITRSQRPGSGAHACNRHPVAT